jgi:hypothetical protein
VADGSPPGKYTGCFFGGCQDARCERVQITCTPAPDPTKPNSKIVVSRHYEIPRDVAQSERFRVFEKSTSFLPLQRIASHD